MAKAKAKGDNMVEQAKTKPMPDSMHPMTVEHPPMEQTINTGGSGMGGMRGHAPAEGKGMGGAKGKGKK